MKTQLSKFNWIQAWNNYWFKPIPLFDLAILRVIVVTFQIVYLLKGNYLDKLYKHTLLADSFYQPSWILRLLLPFGSDYQPSFMVLAAVFWLTLISGVTSLVGYKTRISLTVFAISNLIMQTYIYAFGDFHHPEALMIITLMILPFSPAGQVFSLDNLLRRIGHNVKQVRFSFGNNLEETSPFASWPLLLIRWMYAWIYLSAAVSKLTYGPKGIHLDWVNGITLQAYLVQDGLRWHSDLGVWLGQHHTLALISSWVALLFELTFGLVLIFPKLARFYIPLGASFHIGIYLAQKAPFFQYLAIYSVFIPWTKICHLFTRRNQPKAEIFFDGMCPLCIRSMTTLSYFDWFERITYSEVQERWKTLNQRFPHLTYEDGLAQMHLLLPNGKVKKGFFAFRSLLWFLPPLYPLLIMAYFPGASVVGPQIYQFVASRRKRLTEDCGCGAKRGK